MKRPTTVITVSIAAAAVLAGCGSAASSTPGHAYPPAATPAQDAGPTLAQAAAEAGATDVQATYPTMYASHEGHATWHGRTVDIATFQTQQLGDQWIAVAKTFAPILATGNLWAMAGM